MSIQNETIYVFSISSNSSSTSSTSSSSSSSFTVPPSVESLSKTVSGYCSLSKFLNLPILKAPATRSVISSSLWNSIVENLYSAYGSLTRVLSALSNANQGNLLSEIYTFYDAFTSPTPYEFTPLLHAKKGIPLTAKDFDALVNALEEVYTILNQSPPYSVSPAFGDAIVKSETFGKIVYDVNFLRRDALQSVLLLSAIGNNLNSLPSNFAGQNVFVCSLSTPVILSGFITIENLFLYLVLKTLTITGNTSISKLIVQDVYGQILLQDTVNIQNMAIGEVYGTVSITDFSSVQNLVIDEIPSEGKLILGENAYVQNLTVNTCKSGSIVLQDYAYVGSLGGQASECISNQEYQS